MRRKSSVLLLVAIFLLNVGYAASAKVYLVSVGISDYPGRENDLALPANDAKLVTQIYLRNSRNTEYIQLLNSQATVENILNAMRSLYARAGENDIVVFFFSGHGYPGGFCAYDHSPNGRCLSYEKIRKAIAPSRAKSKMIFADACFAGKITTPQREEHANAKANVMLFLAARSNEYSYELGRTMSNGIFTTYLTRVLVGEADRNHDRIITARELYDFVHPEVIRRTHGEQHPKMWGNFPDNMKVMVW